MKRFFLAALILVSFLTVACNEGDEGGGSVASNTAKLNLTLGERTTLITGTLTSNGGVLSVDDPNNEFYGMTITIPAGAFEGSKNIHVSYRAVHGHNGGSWFNPLTSLISIASLGEYSNKIITVRIPIDLSSGHFPMGFYLNPGGFLEGMPIVSREPGFITVGVRHFSDFLVSEISESALSGGVIKSNFVPGYDDWQFPNRGTIYTPDGQCEGHSVTELWYYYEKAFNGAPDLYGLYDNNAGLFTGMTKTPEIAYDDTLAYKLTSVVQGDTAWEDVKKNFFPAFNNVSTNDTWRSFAYSILVSAGPQFIGLRNTVTGEARAMIVYKVYDGTLFVADPIYPGATQKTIEFYDGWSEPYYTAPNGDEAALGTQYDQIVYFGKTAIMNIDVVWNRWAQMEAQTIGNSQFPECNLYTKVSGWETEIKANDFTAESSTMEVYGRWTYLGDAGELGIDVYTTSGNMKYKDGTKYILNLEQGENILGFFMWFSYKKNNITYKKFGDFRWVNIQYNP